MQNLDRLACLTGSLAKYVIAFVCLLAVALVLLVNLLSFLSPVSISIRIVHLFTVDSDARL
jgi:hypothetical protein